MVVNHLLNGMILQVHPGQLTGWAAFRFRLKVLGVYFFMKRVGGQIMVNQPNPPDHVPPPITRPY